MVFYLSLIKLVYISFKSDTSDLNYIFRFGFLLNIDGILIIKYVYQIKRKYNMIHINIKLLNIIK